MVTLTLLDTDSEKQQWTFDLRATIRVGRSLNNDLVLNDHQVSRHHLDLHPSNPGSTQGVWQLKSYGTNGTLLNGTLVTQGIVSNGSTIQLGVSGPVLKFEIQVLQPMTTPEVLEQRIVGSSSTQTSPVSAPTPEQCLHSNNEPGNRFCIHCGEPLQTLDHIRQYQVVQILDAAHREMTFLVRPTASKGTHLQVLQRFQPEPVAFSQTQRQFEQTVAQLSTLEHPGVPKIVETFVEIPYLYLVTEQMLGLSLKEWIKKEGPVSPEVAIATLLPLLDCLKILHTLEPPFIHGKLTPENIMVSFKPQGPPDLGRLRTLGLGFLPQNALTVQSDLYRIGTACIFLLTGENPLKYINTSRLRGHIQWSAAPQVPSVLHPILEQATHPNPQHRYATAAELANAFGTAHYQLLA